MKRRNLLKTTVLGLGLILLLAGCQRPEPNPDEPQDSIASTDTQTHVCVMDDGKIVEAPSCLKEGVEVRTCTVCGGTQTLPLAKIDCHFGEWVTTEEPTFEKDGVQTRTCLTCGETETEAIPKLDSVYTITCRTANGKKVTVKVAEDGVYSLTVPERIGYEFAGWKTESGDDFAAEGTITESVTVVAQWTLGETSSFAQLKERIEAGAGEILLSADIVLSETIYVTDETVIYVREDHTLTRSPDFIGDLFVLGETADGKNVILTGKQAILTLRTENGATLTLDGNKENMTADAKGTGFFLLNSSTLNLHENVTIQNCKKVGNLRILAEDGDANLSQTNRVGGAAVIVADGVFNMYGGTISDCEVNLSDAKNTAEEDQLEGYHDSSCGGAIFNRSTFNLYGGVIRNNRAARGGAIYNYRTCHLKAGLIENNYAAVYGGAMYQVDSQYTYATVGDETDTAPMTLQGNTSEKSGGAIFGSHMSVLVVNNSAVFEENKSLGANGGAVNMAGAVTVQGGTFRKNIAASKGGAIYVYYGDAAQTVREVKILGGTFDGNSAAKGGALALGASNSDMVCGTTVTVGLVTFRNNTAFMTEDSDPTFIDNVDREGVTREENGNGGAIYAFYQSHLIINDGAFFEQNTAQAKGGAIYITTAGTKLTIDAKEEAQPVFERNSAGGNGGAVYMYTGTEMNASYAIFRDNASHSSKYGGGAFYFTGSKGVLNQVTLCGNQSEYNGGAIAVYSGAEVSLNDTVISENIAKKYGGAVYSNESTVILNGLTAEGNCAVRGGAIYATDSSQWTGSNLSLMYNSSTDRAGAAYVTASTFTVSDLVVEGNTCGTDEATREDGKGGAFGIYSSSVVTLTGLTADKNEAYGEGGFMYISGSEVTVAGVETPAMIQKNVSTADHGGAISVRSGATLTLFDVFFGENKAAERGGAIYVFDAHLVLGDADHTDEILFEENSAKSGGALYIAKDDTSATLSGYYVVMNANNASDKGGAMYLYTDAVVEIRELVLGQNTAEVYGGGIYASGKAQVTIHFLDALENTASMGGFLYLTSTGTTVTIWAGDALDNEAVDGGDTVYCNSAKAVLRICESAFTYLEGTITGKSGFAVTPITQEDLA